MAAKSPISDRTPFWGVKVSPEFKYLQQIFNNKIPNVNISRTFYRELFKLLVSDIIQDNSSKIQHFETLKTLGEQNNITVYHATLIYASLLKLFRSAVRLSSTKQEVIKEDLNDFLKRELIESSLFKKCPQNVSLLSMNWRVDVSISTSSLSRTLEPSIFLEMNLSNGQKISFEMTLNTFHLLRFNVALVLKEMEDLLNRQMFKLLDQ